jgi:tRNA pseudouridine13 synthase
MLPSAYLTAVLPGIGGRLRSRPEDFLVDEIPLRPPSGRGEYLRLRVEKRRRSTPEVVRTLARLLNLPSREIGVAGNKDSDAITRQWLSLPARALRSLEDLAADPPRDLDDVHFVSLDRDHEPLHTGDLRGNRFRIVVRDPAVDVTVGLARSRAIAAVLAARGCPNFFGPQRFGTRGHAADVGGAILRRDFDTAFELLLHGGDIEEDDERARAFRAMCRSGDLHGALEVAPHALALERTMIVARLRGETARQVFERAPLPDRRILLTAWQAKAFNRIVERRLDSIDVAQVGDLLREVADGSWREVLDEEERVRAQRAVDAGLVDPTAPLFGSRVPLGNGAPGAIEREVLAAERVEPAAFDRPLDLTLPGERRPVRFRLLEREDAAISITKDRRGIDFEFALPRGCFATSYLREVTKVG